MGIKVVIPQSFQFFPIYNLRPCRSMEFLLSLSLIPILVFRLKIPLFRSALRLHFFFSGGKVGGSFRIWGRKSRGLLYRHRLRS